MGNDWQVNSWQKYTVVQQPEYEDEQEYAAVLRDLATKPPLVQAQDILRLRDKLETAAAGKAFILQAGDCAERFSDCMAGVVRAKLSLIEAMATRCTTNTANKGKETGQGSTQSGAIKEVGKEIIKIGRIAGQYAKPRSAVYVAHQGKSLPNYFGDAVNGSAFDASSRQPKPSNLVAAYIHAAKTLAFMTTHPQIFTSHEGLLLAYEQAQVREDNGRYFDHSGHMLWIGARSCSVNSAHVELLRGVDNPIGVKVSSSLTAEELVAIVQRLNPSNEAGKIILIMRLGKIHIADKLPQLIAACAAKNLQVVWMVDPMHGNTKQVSGIKTRYFDDICAELETSFRVHRELGSHLGGVHLEVANSAVTECVGVGVSEFDLPYRYESGCDPRLNRAQGLALAEFIATLMPS